MVIKDVDDQGLVLLSSVDCICLRSGSGSENPYTKLN